VSGNNSANLVRGSRTSTLLSVAVHRFGVIGECGCALPLPSFGHPTLKGTRPQIREEVAQVILPMWWGFGEGNVAKMKNGLGRDLNAGLKPLAQCMEALRADGQVGFNRLPRTEAGFQSAADSKVENGLRHNVNQTVFWLAELAHREDDGRVACIRKQIHI
jgi:hypothetical protein